MALVTDNLSVWQIGFRWAGQDPDRVWLRIPLLVKDNFRLLMEAILSGEILCETLTLAKLPRDSKADPAFYIRTYVDDIYDCIHGRSYNRKLLKWATLDRMEFREWCHRRGIPLPEFWFPPGWKDEFEMPEMGTTALRAEHVEPDSEGGVRIHYGTPDMTATDENIKHPENIKIQRHSQKARLACQQIAREIWKDDISRTIISVVKDELIQKYGGAKHYEDETVRGWVKEVAPKEVSSRRGRPPKNGGIDTK